MRFQQLSIALACLGATVVAVADDTLFEETFDGPMTAGWQWVHPAPADHLVEDGRLGLLLSPGGVFEDDRRGRNFLLRDLPRDLDRETGDILVSVDVSHAPEGLYENAGLILYEDDDNYIVVTKESYPGYDPIRRVQIVVERDGHASISHHAPYDDAEVSMALRIGAGAVEGLYRSGDEEWISLGKVSMLSGARPRIGIKASYGVDGVRRWAWFDNFRVASSQGQPKSEAATAPD